MVCKGFTQTALQVVALSGVVEAALTMPDIHWGSYLLVERGYELNRT